MSTNIEPKERNHREDSFVWALQVAAHGTPVSDVLADAAVIRAYMGGEMAPTEQAIVTVQRYRDALPNKLQEWQSNPWPSGGIDEFLGDLIRDLREPVIDAEVVDEEPRRPDWADVAQFADITAERDRARDTAARLEQHLAEKERELDETRQHLIKGTLQHALALARTDTTRSGIRVVQLTAEKFGVEL